MVEPGILVQILWTGLATSTYYALFAIAFALTLKVARLWNFAQAGIMGLAFFAMFAAFGRGAPVWLGVAVGLVVAGAGTVALEEWGLRVLRRRRSGSLTFFIFTLVFSEFVAYTLTLVFGTEPQTLFPSILSPVRLVGGIAVSDWDLIAVGVTLLLLVALFLFLRFTPQGQFMVAVADNAELAELYGISAGRAYLASLLVAAVFVTLGMYLYGTRSSVIPNTPLELMLFAVIATILGGIGSVFGAALAAVILALLQSFSVLVVSSRWQGVLVYAFLFLVMLFFPRGFRLPRRLVLPRARRSPLALAERPSVSKG